LKKWAYYIFKQKNDRAGALMCGYLQLFAGARPEQQQQQQRQSIRRRPKPAFFTSALFWR